MISLLGALIGFISSIAPRFVDIFRDSLDRKHELELFRLQIQAQKQLGTQRVQEIAVEADADTYKDLYKTYYSGIRWIDALNGTVRPVIAYSFFITYVAMKVLTYYAIPYDAPLGYVVNVLWTEADMAIFSGIIAFYFGNRVFDKVSKWRS